MTARILAPTPTLIAVGTAAQVAAAYWDHPADKVWAALCATYDSRTARDLRRMAMLLLEQHCPRTRYALVITAGGVDHDPVPGQPATVCGLALPDVPRPSDLGPAQGAPCFTCFPPPHLPEPNGANQ